MPFQKKQVRIVELFLDCQGMATECRTGSEPALHRRRGTLLSVAGWRFRRPAAASLSQLWPLLPTVLCSFLVLCLHVCLRCLQGPSIFCYSLLLSASLSTQRAPLPPTPPFDVLAPSRQLFVPTWWLAHSLKSSLF